MIIEQGSNRQDWCFWIVVLETDSLESLGRQGDQTSQSKRKSTLNTHWKDWCQSWSSNILAAWCKELTHWKRPWCCERPRAGGEGDDGWMASSTQWTWVWVNSGRWWRTGKPGVLESMGSQRIRHNLATEQWTTHLIFTEELRDGETYYSCFVHRELRHLDTK